MGKFATNKAMLFETFFYMDVSINIKLHPLANEYLFKYYNILRRIFSNVIGQLETDYLSIALIDETGQLIFLSSKPSIEQNLIEKKLLEHDKSYQACFVYQDKPGLWSDLYQTEFEEQLFQFKQVAPGFETGISIPTNFDDYRAIFSFGFCSLNTLMKRTLPYQHEKLLAMGKYCLREIINTIPLPKQNEISKCKPHLELIINNNLVNYDRTTESK